MIAPTVALLRHDRTGLIEPAAVAGRVIVGLPIEMRAAFGWRTNYVTVAGYVPEAHGSFVVELAEWLARG